MPTKSVHFNQKVASYKVPARWSKIELKNVFDGIRRCARKCSENKYLTYEWQSLFLTEQLGIEVSYFEYLNAYDKHSRIKYADNKLAIDGLHEYCVETNSLMYRFETLRPPQERSSDIM